MLGIYIHIPFCASKCSYCDFYSLAGHESKMDKYQNALIKHIEETAPQMAPYYIDTIYFGGGTPSFYGAKRICELFNTLKRTAKVLKTAEVTVEMNPSTASLRMTLECFEQRVSTESLSAFSRQTTIY